MSGPGSIAAELLNRLRLRYPRRITVQLGDIDAVFEPVGTVHGKKQRLQALGHYYETFTAASGNTVTEAYTNCLAYWQAKREGLLGHAFATPADLETDLQTQLRQFVVEGGVIPARGTDKKVRLPGALTFSASGDLGNGAGAAAVADGAPLSSARFNDEAALWSGNTALGKIPITVTVEKRVAGVWVPSPNDWVHFQLVAPFHDAAAHELDDVNALRATSSRPAIWNRAGGAAVAAGPQLYITAAMQNNFDAADPQRYNAHQNRGGKRGLALLANVFDQLPAAGFPGMNAPQASPAPRTHSVRAQSNANGLAGVLFLPSRMAGDRYRMRIFLDPNGGFASDGTEAGAAVFETGRFTVWRHALWSNFLPKPAPTFPALNSIRGVQARLNVIGYDVGPIDGIVGGLTRAAVRAFQHNNLLAPENGHWDDPAMQLMLDATVATYIAGAAAPYVSGLGPAVAPFVFATATAQFRQMYCDLEIEPAIQAGSALTAVQYQEAIRWAIAQVQANIAAFPLYAPRNVSAMFSDEFETPFLFDLRHPRQYNRSHGAGFADVPAALDFRNYWQDAADIIYSTGGLLELFLRYITGRASAASPPTATLTRFSTPGLTVVPAIAASRLFAPPLEPHQARIRIGNYSGCQASGIATQERACAVFGGVNYYAGWVYTGDGFTLNAMHEMGHTLYFRHQFTGNAIGGPPPVPNWMHAGASFREDHDSLSTVVDPTIVPPPVAYDRCLMGYLPCEGEYCGKCHLKLRGWDISQLPV